MIEPKPIIWILADDRPGNVNQCLGVAEALGYPFEIKHIVYNQWVKMPNAVRGRGLMGIDLTQSDAITQEKPDIVISAGRRLAPVARYIKHHFGGKVFLLHLMNPGFPAKGFDLLAIPNHDWAPFLLNRSPIIQTLGACNRVNAESLQQAAQQWYSTFVHLPQKRVALLIGGATKQKALTKMQLTYLIGHVSNMVNSMGGSLLISTSRRTSHDVGDIVGANVNCPYYLYDWHHANEENPYMGMLALSDVLVVTGDSISMCSECCSTGKPTYIYAPTSVVKAKHRRFHATLYGEDYARPLEDSLESWEYAPLNMSQLVASKIMMQSRLDYRKDAEQVSQNG